MLTQLSALIVLGFLLAISCKTELLNKRSQHKIEIKSNDSTRANKPDSGSDVQITPTPRVEDPLLPVTDSKDPDTVMTPAPDFKFDPTKAVKDPFTPKTAGPPTDGNPFVDFSPTQAAPIMKGLLVNPIFTQQVDFSAERAPSMSNQILTYRDKPTAIWLDSIARAQEILPKAMDLALAKATGKKIIVALVIYNLPNRDCFANASNGELQLSELPRYKTEYINPIASILGNSKYKNRVTVLAIIEPDSLPNIVTNSKSPRCSPAVQNVYKEGVAYAIKTLSAAGAIVYLDLAHSGWLGWIFDSSNENPANLATLKAVLKEVIEKGGGKVRGFVTNVANYSGLKEPDNSKRDAYFQANPIKDEYTYIAKLIEAKVAPDPRYENFIIDTSRSGNPLSRQTLSNWCNVRGGGIGPIPIIAPRPAIDAFLWVKPPGESDGVSSAKANRFDSSCQSPDSMRGAPQAGQWFHEHFLELVKNAQEIIP